MTTKTKIILGAGAVLALLLAPKKKANATATAPRPPAPEPTRTGNLGEALGGGEELGIVGTVTYLADGRVRECETNVWAGTPEVCHTYTAAEWARRESALDEGNPYAFGTWERLIA